MKEEISLRKLNNINDTLFSDNINQSNPSFNIKKSKYI